MRIAAVARTLRRAPSRRDVLRVLAATGLGLGARSQEAAVAKLHHQHKHKPKKAKPNAFGCIEVGKACVTAKDCCSGICQGKKGRKLCVAHGTGTCDQEADGFCEAADPARTVCNDTPDCVCVATTAGSKFCADTSSGGCAPCKTDADCESVNFPPGSACAPVATGNCITSPCNGFACFVACRASPPSP
jgi:hypothetical protein